jgi:5-methyltetrahydrofolate--homocysteine methyltransferase
MSDFVKALRSGKVLVMDGAMGTELRRVSGRSYKPRHTPSLRLVRMVHSSYTRLGIDVLLTNTFQSLYSDFWRVAVENARRAHPKPRFILADVGPITKVTRKIAADIFADSMGLDGVLLETWSSCHSLKSFTIAKRSALPVLVSFTFVHGPGGELVTFGGVSPEACARAARRCGAVALGANCGKEIDMDDLLRIVERYRSACDLPIFVRPNAGTPRLTRAGWRYPRTPAAMAAGLPALLEAGVTMVGGCCGTTPEHIRAFREVVDAWNRGRGV